MEGALARTVQLEDGNVFSSLSPFLCKTRQNFPHRSFTQVELRACLTKAKALYRIGRVGLSSHSTLVHD